MTINEIQDELIAEFDLFPEWMDKYEYLIQLGKELPLIEEAYRRDENLIRGCQARVWLHAEMVDGLVRFTADSDAIITKGLVSMVVKVLSGHSPTQIAECDLYFIDRIGFKEHLSLTRSNGLVSMIKQIKWYALAFSSEQASSNS
jgi:cysteine desulfuration protein SufE